MGHVAALVFYQRLFEIAPELRPMFSGDIELQSKKLTDTLTVAVGQLTTPGELTTTLEALGARHLEYGTQPAHYEMVSRALLDMLAGVLGAEFSTEVREAWTTLLSQVSNAMLAGPAKAAA
jgi:hemoglobin-like flavoprotein